MNRNAAILLLAASATLAHAAEDFANVPGLFTTGGWAQTNLSNPVLATAPWGQGDPSQFAAASGADSSYIAANYAATGDASGTPTDVGTISAWLFAPTQVFNPGDRIQFMTRTAPGSTNADRLEVRLSGAGTSTNVGANESSVGSFTTLLATINPNLSPTGYPAGWTSYDLLLGSNVALRTSGRIGFRYFVTDGGGYGNNSSVVALDSFNVQAVPEPATIAVLGLGLVAVARRRKAAR